jgi:hypothetical protein
MKLCTYRIATKPVSVRNDGVKPVPDCLRNTASNASKPLGGGASFIKRTWLGGMPDMSAPKKKNSMSATTKLATLKRKILLGQLQLTDEVVSDMLMLEAEITAGREEEEGTEAYFGDLFS